jgi:hypothetical protein
LLLTSALAVDFKTEIEPLFQKYCLECHGPKKQKSGYRLDRANAALSGGELHAPNIVPGKPDESPLIHFLRSKDPDERMPPKGDRVPNADIEKIHSWIAGGAQWPADSAMPDPDPKSHWAFQPPAHAPIPESTAPNSSPIDRSILSALETAGLTPSRPAPPRIWLRRVHLDLTGLPPSPEEVAQFESNPSPTAKRQVVDALLASPRYGERWAQHWLDVVRYADTHGFEVNTERPHAWPYRDYVIRSFNEDKPYDRFIREQLTGHLVGEESATGFLVTASVLLPGQIGKDAPSMRLARQDSLDEIVVNISQSFLGLSIGCARCHDHKSDPITQREYYAMQSFVAGVEYQDRELTSAEANQAREQAANAKKRIARIETELARFTPLAGSGKPRPPTNAKENSERFAPTDTDAIRLTILKTNSLEPCIDELEALTADGRNVAAASNGATASASGSRVSPNRHELRLVHDGVYGNGSSWMSDTSGTGTLTITFPKTERIERVVWGRDREGTFTDRLATEYRLDVRTSNGTWKTVADSSDRKPLVKNQKQPPLDLSTLPETDRDAAGALVKEKATLERVITKSNDFRVFSGTFRKPDEIRLLSRGDPEQPKDIVPPAVPKALGTLKLPEASSDPERRQSLAEWLAAPANPLTARVMVNRIWQGHFGTGIVETSSDFGINGAKPSHPELLDWLAREFIRAGWSIKHLHRLIVLSDTYAQDSRMRADAVARDADTRLLWRFPPRRLESESMRDATLHVAGILNTKMFGRGFDLFDKRGGLTGFQPVEHFSGDGLRRMIYAHKVRREREAVFGAFDCPDAGQSTARRRESTTPIQALNLLNSRFTHDASEALAKRASGDNAHHLTDSIRNVYQLTLGRVPDAPELQDALRICSQHGLTPLCRALLNSNEFLFLQ